MKNVFAFSIIILAGVFGSLFVTNAQAAPNASLSLTKDARGGLFTLNLRDPEGIARFVLDPASDSIPYSGDLSNCPTQRTFNNIAYIKDPGDFPLKGFIYDCAGNETEFLIEKGEEAGVFIVKKTSPVPTPPQTPSTPSPSSDTAPSTEDISYPIKELGNCTDKEACKQYCDDSANINECLAFAEKRGLLSKKELDRGKKFQEILRTGGGPGGCASEKECENYCSNVNHLDECVAFAEDSGFLENEELTEIKKIHSIIKSGKSLPGNCTSKAECEAYCERSENIDECFAFAKENGFMDEKELREAEKFLPLMKRGETPGGCKSKEACESFCNAEENFEECINFAIRHDLVPPEEAEIIKKTGGKGPGGCRGQACRDYCENPANQKACFEFAREHGLLKKEDLQRMEEGRARIKEELQRMPPEVRACLEKALGSDGISALESGEFFGGADLGDKMRICFEESFPAEFKDKFEMGPEGEFRGPGGCSSHEECERFCRENPQECGIRIEDFGGEGGHEFSPGLNEGGGIPGGFGGPGGCQSPEECKAYCAKHPEECGGFMPPGEGFGMPSGDAQGNYPRPDEIQKFQQGETYRGNVCPSLPTVSECPSGQKRMETFSSPECGTYYTCVPEDSSQHPSYPLPPFNLEKQHEGEYRQENSATFPPPLPSTENSETIYQNQYDEQYRLEYQKQIEGQFDQEFQKQYEEQYQQQQQQLTPPSSYYSPLSPLAAALRALLFPNQ